jgi:hypothetical protein
MVPLMVSWSRPIPPGLWIEHISLYTFIVMVILVSATSYSKWVESMKMLFSMKLKEREMGRWAILKG